MKLLFLDIDGVLNNSWTQARSKTGFLGLDPKLVERFTGWLKRHPEVQIVLSSTWRKDQIMKQEIKDAGIEFIGQTPDYRERTRGDEIQLIVAELQPEKYAILDDNDWMNGDQDHVFVQTDPRYGVSEQDLDQVRRILYG